VRSLRAGDFFAPNKERIMAEPKYREECEIEDVVRRFESCEYAAPEFTHARHLTVACRYLCTLAAEQALNQMRSGLLRFTAHHGKQGYHETITRFWLRLIEDCLRQLPPGMTVVEKVNAVVGLYPSKETLFEYYTREHVMSEIAKREWVEPDLRGFSGPQAR
jgi:hypothetical protein